MAKDAKDNVAWMYEGPQSIINREDYLTGRKIDKNFELYNSDFQEKPTAIDHLIAKTTKRPSRDEPHAQKTSILLDLETIKKEDPLVAIKVKEEKIRREILSNPLKMKRLQTIVMSAMEKKMKKFVRRNSSTSSASPKKKRKSRDDSSSDDDNYDKSSKRRRSDKHRESFHSPRSSSNRRRESRDEEKHSKSHHNSRSTDQKVSRNESPRKDKRTEKRHNSNIEGDISALTSSKRPSVSGHSKCQQHSRPTDSKVSRNESSQKDKRAKNRHDSSAEDNKSTSTSSKPPTIPGYGLIYVNDNSKPSSSRVEPKSRSPPRKSPSHNDKRHEQTTKRKLTEEEKEEKRREMLSNAQWREEQRHKNIQTYKKQAEEEEEKRHADISKPADFIRPLLSAVVDESSVQERIKSKKQSIQRRHNAMDSNFARK